VPRRLFLWILSILLVSITASAIAQEAKEVKPAPPLRFKWWTNEKIIRDVGLTPEQVRRIEAIWTELKPLLEDLGSEITKQENELKALLDGEKVIEKTVENCIDRLYRSRADMEKNKLRLRYRIRDILTPEQRTQVHEMGRKYHRDREQQQQQHPPPEKR